MKLLGISGLDGSVSFKKAHWPGLDEREYRISQGHDSAAALVIDGVCVAAAAEERFNAKKNTAAFPLSATGNGFREGAICPGMWDKFGTDSDNALNGNP